MEIFRVALVPPEEAASKISDYLEILSKISKKSSGRWCIKKCAESILAGDVLVAEIKRNSVLIAVATMRVLEGSEKYISLEDCAGSHCDHWIAPLLECVENAARIFGCRQIVMGGRHGWEKKFHQYGFKKIRVEGVKFL